jgi:hypothetical protein
LGPPASTGQSNIFLFLSGIHRDLKMSEFIRRTWKDMVVSCPLENYGPGFGRVSAAKIPSLPLYRPRQSAKEIEVVTASIEA